MKESRGPSNKARDLEERLAYAAFAVPRSIGSWNGPAMLQLCHSRRMSELLSTADIARTSADVRVVPILLQKSVEGYAPG
jgi:hypothetical protein